MGATGEVPAPLKGSDESTAKPGGNTPTCVTAADNPSKRQPHDVVANFAGDATNVVGAPQTTRGASAPPRRTSCAA
ncbi:hypothetical protein PF005_g26991 [Phytophthora fragariae]|uniref:Uncharacterized protein n=1 Tax=Phytophthora fragariae TaxID=53985 RepID=A0A6A3VWT2_9STRA|nr:hypothetical protein PF003_g13654 [Phytophthora fragariae]KAE8922051.1 hypothetical protein PF009_g27676 [Phytophthora fragariae]KAE8966635.1 hypothetical protein PF011_g27864 [Phytophthora fragariae]KAE9064990.1 hypothetical protein PF010_g28397 [Phytophthora fragariae]KAE9074929.1 hypothetical protein PF006_g28440 [Phytophthora fragariae]